MNEKVQQFKNMLGINDKELATLLSVNHTTITRWGKNSYNKSTAGIENLYKVIGLLEDSKAMAILQEISKLEGDTSIKIIIMKEVCASISPMSRSGILSTIITQYVKKYIG